MTPEPGMVGAIDLKAKAANNFDLLTQGTVVKAVKAVQDKFLGELPEDAIEGSFQEEKKAKVHITHDHHVPKTVEHVAEIRHVEHHADDHAKIHAEHQVGHKVDTQPMRERLHMMFEKTK